MRRSLVEENLESAEGFKMLPEGLTITKSGEGQMGMQMEVQTRAGAVRKKEG